MSVELLKKCVCVCVCVCVCEDVSLVELCTLYLHACQVRVTVGDSGLCCCSCVTCFERQLTPLCVDFARALWASFCFRFVTSDTIYFLSFFVSRIIMHSELRLLLPGTFRNNKNLREVYVLLHINTL